MGLIFGMSQDGRRRALAERIVSTQYSRSSSLAGRYGASGRNKCIDDVTYHLLYLDAAVTTQTPELFREYVGWVRELFERLGIAIGDLADSLLVMREIVREDNDFGEAAAGIIDDALAALRHHDAHPPPELGGLARRYCDLLLGGDRRGAGALVNAALDDGLPLPELYLEVFQPALREVGRLWQNNRINVAQEHLFTAATQLILSGLYPRIFDRPGIGRGLVAVCANGELHEIGIRMVADLFEMAGWDTDYVGASTPVTSVLDLLAEKQPDLLALSVTIAPNIGQAHALIAAVRAAPACRGLRILVGGYPFNQAPDLWRRIGADGWAADARQAVAVGEALVTGGAAP